MRTLHGLKETTPWQESLAQALNIPTLKKDPQALYQLLTTDQTKGLLILDGYDEIAHVVSEKSQNPLSQFITHCLSQPHLHLVLTSRPVQRPGQLHQPRELRVIGFQQAEIEQYLNAYFAHLTLQEFLAPHFLAQSFYTAPDPRFSIAQHVVRDEKYTPRYQVMLPFIAGLLYANAIPDPKDKDTRPPIVQ